jgi:hypothetical protein
MNANSICYRCSHTFPHFWSDQGGPFRTMTGGCKGALVLFLPLIFTTSLSYVFSSCIPCIIFFFHVHCPFCMLNTHHTCCVWIVLYCAMWQLLPFWVYSQFVVLRSHRFRNSCLTSRDLFCLRGSLTQSSAWPPICVSMQNSDIKVKCTLLTAPSCKIQVSETWS